mmetsp:Transcript_49805/g.115634  ORF Transcript_49805/g.115634 Transcript_49805/m.115634 type:complete len:685 (-) Transcript_49805:96-2150(-)
MSAMEAPVAVNEGEVEIASSLYSAARPLSTTLLVTVLLAVDELNPVKVLCSYCQGIFSERHIGCLAALLLGVLAVNQRSRLLYYILRIFFRCTFNNIFFRSVEIVGLENLPKQGPVILTGNHNNQFVDGVMLLTNSHREISFMIAEKSYQRPMVGFLAKAFHCIPVQRPQDTAFKGTGTVALDGSAVLRGTGTQFKAQMECGCSVQIQGEPKPLKVKQVVSDEELVLESEVSGTGGSCTFKVYPKVDQTSMYERVHMGLKQGKCLGIFPEGGSHDRTDLLPLKAGVAVIALDAFTKYGLQVPIVPVGLNYFHGHRFGGRVVTEFGTPINIPESIYALHETDRRGAGELLLNIVATGMRSVIVPVPDYHTLQQIYMVRRLYVPDGLKLSAEKAMDLNRRFAVGLFRIMQLAHADRPRSDGEEAAAESEGLQPPLQPEDIMCIQELRSELEDYMFTLKRLGIRDHHVRQIGWWSLGDLVGRLLYLVVTMALGIIPQVMFNLPVWFLASKLAVTEQKNALRASTVKLAARDVVLSYKIIYVLVFVPVLYLLYGVLICCFSPFSPATSVLVLASLPVLGYLGMKASEQGIRAYADIVPLFMRLLPSARAEQDALPARRAKLQRRLHHAVKTFGPRLGDLYWQENVDWSKEISPVLSASNFGELLEASKGTEGEVKRRLSNGNLTKASD